MNSNNLLRRFGGIARLYGEENLQKFQNSHVMVVGVGGVGSWAAEALVRSGVGKISLVDFDVVAESNVNRQIQALSENFGKNKIDTLAERFLQINPNLQCNLIDDFLSAENIENCIQNNELGLVNAVVDACDDFKAKLALILFCKRHKIFSVISGSAGGQIDPSKIRSGDLSESVQDPLLARIRNVLRKNYKFAAHGKKMKVNVVFSLEEIKKSKNSKQNQGQTCDFSAPLACSGFGSSMIITNTFAMFLVAKALNYLSK